MHVHQIVGLLNYGNLNTVTEKVASTPDLQEVPVAHGQAVFSPRELITIEEDWWSGCDMSYSQYSG